MGAFDIFALITIALGFWVLARKVTIGLIGWHVRYRHDTCGFHTEFRRVYLDDVCKRCGQLHPKDISTFLARARPIWGWETKEIENEHDKRY